MSSERDDIARLAAWLESLLERVQQVEAQLQGLMVSPSVEAQEFVLRDERGKVRARLDLPDHAPRLTFFDPIGDERLHIGLHADGTPDLAGIRG